eukprot:c12696_g1_i3 orf=992-2953(-)
MPARERKKQGKGSGLAELTPDGVERQEGLVGTLAIDDAGKRRKRRKDLGVRVIGGRIYDSENGRTCHQCRQKTAEIMARCKNSLGKACSQNFCPKCLLNRYGETVDKVAKTEDWNCPKCRGICNCSVCMKKQGRAPTGILTHTAKATGFGSVAELLVKCSDMNWDMDDKFSILSKDNPRHADLADRKDNAHMLAGKLKAPDILNISSFRTKNPAKLPGKEGGKRVAMHVKKADGDKCIKKRTVSCEPELDEKCNNGNSLLIKSVTKKPVNAKKLVTSEILGDQNVECTKPVTATMKEKVFVAKSLEKDRPRNSVRTKDTQKKERKNRKLIVIEEGDGVSCARVDFELTNQSTAIIEKNTEKAVQRESKKNGLTAKTIPIGISLSMATANEENLDITEDGHLELSALKEGEHVAAKSKDTSSKKTKHIENHVCKHLASPSVEEIFLPKGQQLATVAGLDIPPGAVGPALQLLEFCSAFAEILSLKKGEPEQLLRECSRGNTLRRGSQSLLVYLHVKLLSIIRESTGELGEISPSSNGRNSWLQALSNHLNERLCVFSIKETNFTVNDGSTATLTDPLLSLLPERDQVAIKKAVETGAEGYERLDLCNKLQLLNVLCDDCLETEYNLLLLYCQNYQIPHISLSFVVSHFSLFPFI